MTYGRNFHKNDDTAAALMHTFHRFKNRKPDKNHHQLHSEHRALLLLNDHGERGMKVSELSKLLHVSSPFATQLVNRFEERGLATRFPDAQDGRIVRIVLTDQGKEEAQREYLRIRKRFEAVVDDLGVKDAETLVRLLNKAFDCLEAERMKQCQQELKEEEST